MLIPEDGCNTIAWSFRNSAKFYKNRTLSTQQQHSRQNLKSGKSKACWLNWAIPLSLFPTNQVSAVQSQCECLNGCSVVAFWWLTCSIFRSRNFYPKQRHFWSAWKESANCGPSKYADTICSEVGFLLNPKRLWMYIG